MSFGNRLEAHLLNKQHSDLSVSLFLLSTLWKSSRAQWSLPLCLPTVPPLLQWVSLLRRHISQCLSGLFKTFFPLKTSLNCNVYFFMKWNEWKLKLTQWFSWQMLLQIWWCVKFIKWCSFKVQMLIDAGFSQSQAEALLASWVLFKVTDLICCAVFNIVTYMALT